MWNRPYRSNRVTETPLGLSMTAESARCDVKGESEMTENIEADDAAFNMQLVRDFLTRYFTIENEIKLLQQDKSELRNEFKERGLDMKTMTAAIAIAKKRQLVPVSKETLDALISEVENKLPASED
jgi:uncharacterized protein (UPF0335 family)